MRTVIAFVWGVALAAGGCATAQELGAQSGNGHDAGGGAAGAGGSAGVGGSGAGGADGGAGSGGSGAGGADGGAGAGGSGAGGADGGAGAGGSGAGGAGGAGGGGCGDGVVNGSEECDDGNTASSDGCSPTCTWESDCTSKNARITLACGASHSGSFSGKWNDVTTPCGNTFQWQDQLFVFAAAADAQVTVSFTASPDQTDTAMFVFHDSCDSHLCLADSRSDGNRHDVTFQAVAGTTYYIDFEAPSQQPSYSITLTCQ